MKRRAAWILFCSLLPATAEPRAQIEGAVRDISDAVLPGASVTAVNEDTGIRRSSRSNENGEYAIASLPAGVYKVTVRNPGFQTIAQLNVYLKPGQNGRLDFTMQVGSMREVITILASPPLMNADDASVGALADAHLIGDLPLNGREVLSIVSLAPGVVTTPATLGEAGQFTANGQRPNANYFTVDGVSANTGVSGSVTPAQFSGGTLPAMTAFGSTQTLSSREGLDEVRVQTSSFAPEFGRTPGANVGITTRSGSNEFHGSALYVGRNDVLNANSWFTNRAGLGRAPERLNDWGATAGGPIRRDRTFFFVTYEGLRLTEPFTYISAVPNVQTRTAAPAAVTPLLNAFPLPNGPGLSGGLAEFTSNASRPAGLDLGSIRVDHALTSRISVFGRYQKAPSYADSGFAQVDHSQFHNDSLTVGAAALASPNISSDLRINVTRTSVQSQWVATGAGGSVPMNLASMFPKGITAGDVLYGLAIGDVGQILSGQGSSSRQGQWNLVETLGWNRQGHAMRFGIDYDRLSPSRDRIATIIGGAYDSLSSLLTNGPMLLSTSQADQASSLVESLSLFAQDTWRVTPRFTATYGLRWELTPAPAYRFSGAVPSSPPVFAVPPVSSGGASAPGSSSPSNSPAGSPLWPNRFTQFAPRLGIAYRLTPATVLRAGWGIFYDVEFGVATDPINAFPYNRWQVAPVAPGLAAPSYAPEWGYGFAPNLKLPYSREWNVSLEHAFRGTDVVSASYVGSASRRLLRREAELGTGIGAALSAQTAAATSPVATNNGSADFNALELQYRRKLTAGFEGLASYSWSHSIDNGSWDSGIYLPSARANDRGSSAFDVRHSFSAGLTWNVRKWLVSSVISARSGFPIDVLASENLLGLGFDDYPRPNLVPGAPIWITDPGAPGGRVLNRAAFMVPPPGVQGNLGRDSITGFGLSQVDLAVGRDFALGEEGVVSFRAEAFNITNHAQFGDPVSYLNSPLFGQSLSMLNLMLGSGTPHSGIAPAFQSGGPRALQITVRFRF